MINKNCIEIDITLRCNLHCPNCNRMSPQKIDLDLNHLQRFVSDNRSWKKIVLIGGEPLLHPELDKVFEIVKPYKGKVAIATNGYDKKLLNLIPSWIKVINSNKTSSDQLFTPFNLAPVDIGITEGFSRGCYIADFCGIAMSVDGLYYPCAAGATVAREFDMKIGQKSVDKVEKWMFEKVCRYCGHFPYDDRDKWEKAQTRQQIFSKSWLERKKNKSMINKVKTVFNRLID
jgi:MoaA/NifB/PqqE/SkfB family radical SAM enzyme